jgi:sigma-B regulation protein RsbU (phosphoserine phosphatase)
LTLRISRLHWLLAAIFVLIGLLDAGEIAADLRQLLDGPKLAHVPFSVISSSRMFGMGGVHFRREVLAIDGKPFTRAWQQLDADDSKRPGDRTTLTLKGPRGQIENIELVARSRAVRGSALIPFVATRLFLPVFCFVLGFAVVAIRIRDPLAWLVLVLLLTFAEAAHGTQWGWPARDLATWLQGAMGDMFPVCMLLFGIYFPHRLDLDVKAPWAKWLLIVPLAAGSAVNGAIMLVWLNDIDAVVALRPVLLTVFFVTTGLGILAIVAFLGSMVRKTSIETDKDARRRISLLWAGAAVGLGPVVGLVVYALLTDQDPGYVKVPAWLEITANALMPVFVLALAYVIVVQRAMNLSVVVRLGLQYALARGGIWILRAIVLSLAIYAMTLGGPHQTERVVVLALILFILQKGLTARVSQWLDRRFFREAYSAEQVLSELSEEARKFTQTGPLLATVTGRVAATLHIPKAWVLVRDGQNYCVAAAPGTPAPAASCLPYSAKSVERIRESRKPALIYFDDMESWVQEIEPDERRRLQALDAQVLLPLAGREDLTGVMVLGPKLSEEPYSGADLRLLQSVATQTGLALENSELLARLSAEAARRERLNRDLEIAREVQQRLFPQSYPPVEGLEYFGYCRPALGIGGDYYDFVQLRNGKPGMAIGDISGKGVAAALLMSNLQASLRGQTLAEVWDLSALMRNINQMMFEASMSNKYATFFYGEYCPRSRRLDFVNAGHNAPIILRGEECLRLEAGGSVVGLLKQADYEKDSIELLPGDILVGFTDGISEAMTVEEEEWEEERFIEELRRSRGCCPEKMIEAVFAVADAFTAGATQYDDMTVVAVKILAGS